MTAFRLSSYAANSSMSPHLHEDCSFIVVIRGGYQETIPQFGSSGSSKLIFVPTASSLEFLSEGAVALTRAPHVRSPLIAQIARRVVAEKRHDDIFSEFARNCGMSLSEVKRTRSLQLPSVFVASLSL
jgi:AraC family transcriptional regulator